MKKQISIAAAAALAVALLGACGSGDAAEEETSTTVAELGAGEGEVNLVAWAGYVEDGSTDPNVDWVTGFEQETGCQVNVKIGNTSDEMVELMQSGEYDAVSASGDATLRLIAGGDVVPVNTDLIPNYADVFEGLKNKPWNSVDGVPYGVPHGRGANVMVYNTEAGAAPTSIVDMFSPESPYAGKISVYDAPIYVADAAIYLMATQPELGITNPYALDQAQFDAAIAALEAQKPIVGQYWSLYTDQQAALESGSVTLGTSWQVIVNLAQANGAKIDATLHAEGSTGWSDTWMISSKAKHPNCAYLWLDHIISPEANAGVAEWFGEAPSNAKSCALTADPNHCATYHADDEEYFSKVYYWTTPTSKCLDGRTDVECVPFSEWVNAWNKLRA
ncbi:MAG: extracellular solute-binding protein [Actinobacteria bacterium]|nr:extracellular solute-binding protein [Actinomycetota bacterium]